MAVPNKLAKINVPGGDPAFAQHYSQLIDTVNSLVGHNGEIEVANHINLGGKRVINVGAPVGSSDALSSGAASDLYSATVLRGQLESNSAQPLRSYRAINNQTQREQTSSWLTDLMSTPPSANTIFPTIANVSGGVQVNIPSSKFTFADGTTVNLSARTDLLSLPAQYAITSISSSGNLVTVVLGASSGLVAGQIMTVASVAPPDFNGTFAITTSSGGGSTLTYQLDLGTLTGSGGFVQVNGVYYYAIKKRQTYVSLFGPFSGDTANNRLQVCFDGFQIVAVVVITNSGGQIQLCGGGGSPIVGSPTAGSFF